MDTKYSWIGCSASALFTVAQTDSALQWIQFGLTLLATAVTIGYTIFKWWKQANADGKIDAGEVAELAEEILSEVSELKNELEDDK